jgi:hypothetical protein
LSSFESYVILNSTKTQRLKSWAYKQFESYVVLNSTKTNRFEKCSAFWFESYVIYWIVMGCYPFFVLKYGLWVILFY